MPKKLHIDIETFSSVDIKTAGAYKYIESPDFEILMIAYALDDEPVRVIDLAGVSHYNVDPFQNSEYREFLEAYLDDTVEKHAHNAVFERRAFERMGLGLPAERWFCSAIKAGYCGFPLSLADVSKAMGLGEFGKSSEGKALIRKFSCPVKPTKANGMRTRNLPHHDPEAWERFKEYCKQDVVAEREISRRLEKYVISDAERENYLLDQAINDRGILIHSTMAANAVNVDARFSTEIESEMSALTGVNNPNSAAQLKKWLSDEVGSEVSTLAKQTVNDMLPDASGDVKKVLQLRLLLAKSSTKKYQAMLNCVCQDGRAHGLFQFYGASRTGRWAGRLVQLQNLPQNHLKCLDVAREAVIANDYDLIQMLYSDVPTMLSELIRTAFIPKLGHVFAVADFSAIEARVIAWLAGEQWRLDVFATHGKIYEASASMMFGVPIESIGKGSDLRQKGKVAELALGYQGAVGALKTMGGERMGLSEEEMSGIVAKWRKANPNIVALWADVDNCARTAIKLKRSVVSKFRGLVFTCKDEVLTIKLPSGRELFYQSPAITTNRFDSESIKYKGLNQETKQWGWVESYGGKLVENIVQAISRDLLCESMQKITTLGGFDIVMHVHDEVVCEVPENEAAEALKTICELMGKEITWAKGLPLRADGYLTQYYKKD